ncbi:MAG: thiamine phosphate synthase [Dehalococcoidia bacterium]
MTLRAADANLDRAAEGLRALEDVARFLLNDTPLTETLRSIRHRLRETGRPMERELLSARDAGGDVGARAATEGRTGPADLVSANAKRVQESLRVLEELAQLPGSPWQPQTFQEARFTLYSVEKELLSRLLRQESRQKISGLYVIIDSEFLRGREEVQLCRQALSGGARVVQLRDKGRDKGVLLPICQEMTAECAAGGGIFLVNDHLDLALASGAHGLHLGQSDLPLQVARRLLSVDRLIGVSAKTAEQARAAQEGGADYVAVGAMFPTTSKSGAVVKGLEALREVKQAVSLPVVAIGGINRDNVGQVMRAGADAIAVINAVLGAPDVEKATAEMAAAIEEAMSDTK